MQASDTSAIQRLIGRARRRIRAQRALEGATTAAIVAAAAALAAIFAIRIELVDRAGGIALLAGSAAIIAIGAALAAARRIDDESVARRIDRASNLADRLSTAVAFNRAPIPADGDPTHELMHAAIRDGVRAVPRADVARATPFAAPVDLRAALGFLAISALAAGLSIPTVDRSAHVFRAEPDHGAAGDEVAVVGVRLTAGLAHPIAALPTRASLGAAAAPAEATAPPAAPAATATPEIIRGFVPTDAMITLGAGSTLRTRVIDWSAERIAIQIPEGAPIGPTVLTVWIHDEAIGAVPFTVIDRRDPRYHKADSVALDPDDRAYLDALVAEIKAVGKRDDVPELEDFAKQIEQLLQDAELGKISKEKLLESLAKAEEKLEQKAEPDQADLDKQLAELGKQLAKDQLTKELGEALQKTDLDKAQKELEKLADKLDKKEFSEKEQEQLAKQLEKAAKQLEDKQQQEQKKQDQKKQKLQDEIRRLEKKKEQAKTEQEQLDTERQLEKKKDELKKLEKDEQDKEQSAQRQALKRLTKDLDDAADQMQNKAKDKDKQDKDKQGDKQGDKQQGEQDQDKQDQQGQNAQQQAAQKLKDAARETGRVDRDRRKQATQKKMSSQMEDLREAMRRAKQKGNKDGKDPFGKQNKNQDFAQRARGQRGQSQAWKPGQQGQGGQGQGQQGQGQQPGQQGKEWGVGHDDNLVGDPTQKSGNTKDDDLQGKQGSQGGGTRETILAAAQKGFASVRYRDVYGKYHQIVEEVMRTEKLPSSYKYYVKRYFAKIHPSADAAPSGDPPAAPEGTKP